MVCSAPDVESSVVQGGQLRRDAGSGAISAGQIDQQRTITRRRS